MAHIAAPLVTETPDARLMRDLRDFANQWDRNLRALGFVEVFERQYGVLS